MPAGLIQRVGRTSWYPGTPGLGPKGAAGIGNPLRMTPRRTRHPCRAWTSKAPRAARTVAHDHIFASNREFRGPAWVCLIVAGCETSPAALPRGEDRSDRVKTPCSWSAGACVESTRCTRGLRVLRTEAVAPQLSLFAQGPLARPDLAPRLPQSHPLAPFRFATW